jgi:NAD(P)H-dependent flavin oxidoreductase YrpB (nitropropane dioxygenase family)
MTIGFGERVCRLFEIEAPIVLAGMAAVTDARLVAAVSNAGGLGLIGTVDRTPEQVVTEVSRIRALTNRPFGINVVIADATPEIWETVFALKPPVLSTSWGDVTSFVSRARDAGSRLLHGVTAVSQVEPAVLAGVDALVAQGADGGGHVGTVGTFALLPQVVDAAPGLPVLASGGIIDGRGLAAAVALGADGVVMGTRFLASLESPIRDSWMAAMVNAAAEDIIATTIPDIAWGVHWPSATSRVIRNQLIDDWLGREQELRQSSATVGARMSHGVASGSDSDVPLYAGQGAGGIHEILPASTIIGQMMADARATIQRLAPDGGARAGSPSSARPALVDRESRS